MSKNIFSKQHPFGQVFRYGIMASLVVTIEIGSFWIFNSKLTINYLVSTALSMFVGIILNWLGSKFFVFNKSRFHPAHEFLLVAIASIVGVGLQLVTVYFVVQYLLRPPIIGKFIAICVTFVWNFLVRKLYIFKNVGDDSDIDPYLT